MEIIKIKQERHEIYNENDQAIKTEDCYCELNNEIQVKIEAEELLEYMKECPKELDEVDSKEIYENSTNLVGLKAESEQLIDVLLEEHNVSVKQETGQPLNNELSLSKRPYAHKGYKQKSTRKSIVKKRKNYQCPICGKKFSLTPSSRKKHMDAHFKNYLAICFCCGIPFTNKQEFSIHIFAHFVKKQGKRQTRSTFQEVPKECLTNNLPIHSQSNSTIVSSILPKSVFEHSVLSYYETYNDPNRSQTYKRKFKCDKCFKCYSTETALFEHRRIHIRKTTICLFCSKIFPINDFKQHLVVHSSREPYNCRICHREFQRAAKLRAHLFEHHEVQNVNFLECQICASQFKSASGFKIHFKGNHHEYKNTEISTPIIISQTPCSKIEESEDEEVIEEEEGLHKCDKCLKSFDEIKCFRAHVSNHNFYQLCKICSQPWHSRHNLRKHVKSHAPLVKPFVCIICSYEFMNRSTLQKHLLLEQRQDVDKIVMKCNICCSPIHFFVKSIFFMHLRNFHKPNFDPVVEDTEFVQLKSEVIIKEETEVASIKSEVIINEEINLLPPKSEVIIKEELEVTEHDHIN